MAHGQQFGKVSSLLCCVRSCVSACGCVFIPSGRICPSAPARCLLQRGPGALSSRAVREVSFVFCETLSCRSFVSLRVLLVDVFSLVVFVFRPTHRAVRALPPFFRLSRSRIFSGLPARSLRCVINRTAGAHKSTRMSFPQLGNASSLLSLWSSVSLQLQTYS